MNPLEWKAEHRLAFMLAISFGAALGAVAALMRLRPFDYDETFAWYCTSGHYGCAYFRLGYWALVLFCAAVGGAACGLIVYIRQLLR
jgi:H+/Cl- antiporter ClcA